MPVAASISCPVILTRLPPLPQPRRINRELDGDLDIDRFEHVAFYNEAEGRIEIYIRSLANQEATAV